MSKPDKDNQWLLTEKEKQTLRLIVRGHDAKSIARSIGLSVHTINERLRDARRKMSVSSSREAARILLEHEGGAAGSSNPDLSVDVEIGEDAPRHVPDQEATSNNGAGWAYRHPRTIIGGFLMTLALGLLALTALPQVAPSPSVPVATHEATNPEVVDAARQWLALLDQSKWEETYRATGSAFRKLNTLQVWSSVSEKVRAPLGAAISRTFVSQENLPAPPSGYEVVKFRTSFANKAEALETVSLDREDGKWRVVGVTVG
jgi:DNA-binding CsgD family transcriptional regulator